MKLKVNAKKRERNESESKSKREKKDKNESERKMQKPIQKWIGPQKLDKKSALHFIVPSL